MIVNATLSPSTKKTTHFIICLTLKDIVFKDSFCTAQ